MDSLKNNTTFNKVFNGYKKFHSRNKENIFELQNFENMQLWKKFSMQEKTEIFCINNEKLLDFGLENLIYLLCYQVFFK